MKMLGQIHSFPITNTLIWPNNPVILEFITNLFVQYNTNMDSPIKAPKLSICYYYFSYLMQFANWSWDNWNGTSIY